jgi:hypothetical protein
MKKLVFAASAVLFFGMAQAAFAQQGGAGDQGSGQGRGNGGIRAACAADMQKLCPNAQDRDARRQCLTDNKAQLSSECTAALAAGPQHGQK